MIDESIADIPSSEDSKSEMLDKIAQRVADFTMLWEKSQLQRRRKPGPDDAKLAVETAAERQSREDQFQDCLVWLCERQKSIPWGSYLQVAHFFGQLIFSASLFFRPSYASILACILMCVD
jgi:hypothetical protein